MNLLTPNRLMLRFTNTLVNVVLKFYVVSLTHGISTFKSRNPQRPSLLNLDHLRYNQMQFKRVEVAFQWDRTVYPRLSDLPYELERTVSHSNSPVEFWLSLE